MDGHPIPHFAPDANRLPNQIIRDNRMTAESSAIMEGLARLRRSGPRQADTVLDSSGTLGVIGALGFIAGKDSVIAAAMMGNRTPIATRERDEDMPDGRADRDTPLRTLPNGVVVAEMNRMETDYLYEEIWVRRTYTAPEFVFPASPIIVDAGANIGMFARFALAEWPAAQVHAVEPMPGPHAALVRNAELTPGDLRPYQYALGAAPGSQRIRYYPAYTILSGISANPERDYVLARDYLLEKARDMPRRRALALRRSAGSLLRERFVSEEVTVEVRTLTELVEGAGLDRVDLLKVDVEGAELAVLGGVADRLWPAVRQVVVEVDDAACRLSDVVGLLRGHGFGVRVEPGQGEGMHLAYGYR